MVDRFWVRSAMRGGVVEGGERVRAAAVAASQPACPPPITSTS